MNASLPNRDNIVSDLASQRADDVSSGRQRLEARRGAIERYRANELAEAEALALARIKADTERALAHQAQVLRDAERAAELAAIERRSADLEAIKEVQRRQTLDQEAAAAAATHAAADHLAKQTALQKKSVLVSAHEARQARLTVEREALAARRDSLRARLGLAWVAIRSASPIAAGLVALLLGIIGGWLLADLRDNTPQFGTTEEAPLKLDSRLMRPPAQR